MNERMELLMRHRNVLRSKMIQLEEDCIRLDEKIEYYKTRIEQARDI